MEFNQKDSFKKKDLKRIIYTLNRCLGLLFNYNKCFIGITFIVTIIQGLIPTISLIIMQKIINNLQVSNQLFDSILNLIILFIIVEAISLIISEVYGYYQVKVSKNFDKRIDMLIINKATTLKLQDFEDSETYDIINRAQNQNGDSILNFCDSFMHIIEQVVTIISSIFIIYSMSKYIVLIILIMPTIQYFYSIKIGKKQYKVNVERTSKQRKLWYIKYLILTGNAYKEIKLYKLKDVLCKNFKELQEQIINQDVCIIKNASIVNLIIGAIDLIISGLIYVNIIYNGFKKIFLIGDVTTYINCIQSIKNSIHTIFYTISSLVQTSLFIGLFFEFLDIESIQEDNTSLLSINNIENIELINLSYKYRGSEVYALKDINLKFEINNIFALVGRNGSGKSTLIKIILGYYDDYEGEILVNGINLRLINKQSYMSNIGCVFQDYIKYEASLRENIAYGNNQYINNDDKLNDIIQFLNINKKIYEKEGLDTILGNWFSNRQLSAGEWQKIAIARALIKEANLYILDEPDASLDAEAEIELLFSYKDIFESKIGIFISHKINHIKLLTDNIIVLDRGKVLEIGNHKELMERKGIYYDFYIKQSIETKEAIT